MLMALLFSMINKMNELLYNKRTVDKWQLSSRKHREPLTFCFHKNGLNNRSNSLKFTSNHENNTNILNLKDEQIDSMYSTDARFRTTECVRRMCYNCAVFRACVSLFVSCFVYTRSWCCNLSKRVLYTNGLSPKSEHVYLYLFDTFELLK